MLLILDSEYCIVNICDSTQRKTQGPQTKKTRGVKSRHLIRTGYSKERDGLQVYYNVTSLKK